MGSLPLPVRVAAGLAATAAERVRALPTSLLGLPVTMASQALQVSMRVQQQITELAIKGDEVLAGPATEQPAWTTFDEDEEPDDAGSPPAVPDYDRLTLPQLRGKLRTLTVAELTTLLEHERTHRQRPEFLRMLANRLDRMQPERRSPHPEGADADRAHQS